MGRKKLSIKYLEKKYDRSKKFPQRKIGLLKKAAEFGILFGGKIALVFTDLKGNTNFFSNCHSNLTESILTNVIPGEKIQDVLTYVPDDYPFIGIKPSSQTSSEFLKKRMWSSSSEEEEKTSTSSLQAIKFKHFDEPLKTLKLSFEITRNNKKLPNTMCLTQCQQQNREYIPRISLREELCLIKKFNNFERDTFKLAKEDECMLSLPLITLNSILKTYFKNNTKKFLQSVPRDQMIKILDIGSKAANQGIMINFPNMFEQQIEDNISRFSFEEEIEDLERGRKRHPQARMRDMFALVDIPKEQRNGEWFQSTPSDYTLLKQVKGVNEILLSLIEREANMIDEEKIWDIMTQATNLKEYKTCHDFQAEALRDCMAVGFQTFINNGRLSHKSRYEDLTLEDKLLMSDDCSSENFDQKFTMMSVIIKKSFENYLNEKIRKRI